MNGAEITTLELARVIGVSVQTIRRTARDLDISPQKSGKSFVFTPSQASQIANRLRRHIPRDVAENGVDGCGDVSKTANDHSVGLFGAIDRVIGSVTRQEVTIGLEEYSALVSKSSKFESAKEREELLMARIDVLERDVEGLRRELEEARERLYEARHRRLTWRERLFGRPMPSLPERAGD